MTGFDVSALNSPLSRILVIGPNWLGDGIMAMPALQRLRERLHPQATLHIAVKPNQTGLWRMHPDLGAVLELPPRSPGIPPALRSLRQQAYTAALLLPNSFRSALLPALARIPVRRGTATQGRRLLITDPVDLAPFLLQHQQIENAALLLPGPTPESLPPPRLNLPPQALARADTLLQNLPRPLLGLIPGSARGPAKRWPPDRFRAVADAWLLHTPGSVLWLGTPNDAQLCQSTAQNLPPHRSRSLAGSTDLPTFAATLAALRTVVANDSGGMHLAAAVDTPPTAIFGLTDPRKTAPLHPQARVFQHAQHLSRSVPRDSLAARRALEAVPPQEVIQHVLAFHSPST